MAFKNSLMAIAAGAMLVAPMAANAGTTASASVGKIAKLPAAASRQSVAVKKKDSAESGVVVLAVLAAGAVGYGLYKAVDGDSNTSNGS